MRCAMGDTKSPTTTVRSETMANKQRLLCAALLLSCSSAAPDRPSKGVRRRRTRPGQHHNRQPGHQLRPTTATDEVDVHPTYRHLSTGEHECSSLEQIFKLSFQTDLYGKETSWFLRRESDQQYVGFGPPTGVSYGDFTLYSFSYCLTVGQVYTLAMEDNFGDGMCCSRGEGGYEYSLGGVMIYTSGLRPTFRDYVEHTFTVEAAYSPAPTVVPTEEPNVEMECVANPTECGCEDVDHEDYLGTISTTEYGYTCQAWNVQTPWEHEYTPTDFPNGGLEGNNYCRSPDGGTPWCFTTDPEVEWDYCRVPDCASRVKVVTKSPTKSPTLKPTLEPDQTASPTTPNPTNAPSSSPTVSPSLSPSKSPTPSPTLRPTPKPTPGPNVLNTATGCYGGDVHIHVEVMADKYSDDTSWDLFAPNGTSLMGHPPTSFGEYEYKSSEVCVPHGNYTFEIRDAYNDGMCCRYGEGFFKVHLDGREVLNGGSFNSNVTATLRVGWEPNGYMTQREYEYLEAHNYRRKEWHERYNLTYVPLIYSPGLAKQSKAWAEELLHSCGIVGIEHEDFIPYGENLAKNTGNPETWGRLYPAENIVRRWVDFEIGLPYPSNGHLTQALWRASKYLGCGESVKDYRGGLCRIQVCRYGRAGNCDMTRFNSTIGENWLVPMLDNYTRCGPDCPPEGCY